MSEQELAKVAKKRAQEKAGFWVHLGIYIVVNVFLAVQWGMITGGIGFPWFLSTAGGWGIGLVAHFLAVFAGKSYVEREAQREIRRLRQQHG